MKVLLALALSAVLLPFLMLVIIASYDSPSAHSTPWMFILPILAIVGLSWWNVFHAPRQEQEGSVLKKPITYLLIALIVFAIFIALVMFTPLGYS